MTLNNGRKPPIDFEELIRSNNSFWIKSYAHKLNVIAWIMENPTDELVQKIWNWDGSRKIDYSDDNERNYVHNCYKLWEKITHYDSGCSSTNDSFYQFISDIVVMIISHNIDLQKKMKQEKINKLKKEIERLEADQNA